MNVDEACRLILLAREGFQGRAIELPTDLIGWIAWISISPKSGPAAVRVFFAKSDPRSHDSFCSGDCPDVDAAWNAGRAYLATHDLECSDLELREEERTWIASRQAAAHRDVHTRALQTRLL